MDEKELTLKEIQRYMKKICSERGWDNNSYLEIFLLFSEEIGELAKAIREHNDLCKETDKSRYNLEKDIKKYNLEEEFADVFNYLVNLANYFDIDLEMAFRKKEAINSMRRWK